MISPITLEVISPITLDQSLLQFRPRTTHPSLAKYWNDTGPSIVIPPKPVPTIEELLASPESPYIWLDPEFEAPLERAIAKVEKNTSIVRGSQDWRSAIGDQYRHYLRKYYVEERPVIPFVPATDEQLREWESDAMWRFREEEELCDLYRLMTTPEALQEHWRKANEQAAKSHCYRKSDRETFRISDFKELVRRGLVELKDWMWREDHPPTPPPPRIEIDLPKEWFAEDDEGVPAKSIDETVIKLAPIVHYVLPKYFQDVRVEEDYIFLKHGEFELKIGREKGAVWFEHHAHWNDPEGDLLNLFKFLWGIDDNKKC